MAFDSPRLKAVSDSASLIAGSNLFQISELKKRKKINTSEILSEL